VAAKDSETPISKTVDFPDIKDLSYEQARDELISIVAQLEGGQIGLEESMALWQRGEALATHCNTWLDGSEAKLTAAVTEAGPPEA
jgi:exodeoxyribonuclease VII small subunit